MKTGTKMIRLKSRAKFIENCSQCPIFSAGNKCQLLGEYVGLDGVLRRPPVCCPLEDAPEEE